MQGTKTNYWLVNLINGGFMQYSIFVIFGHYYERDTRLGMCARMNVHEQLHDYNHTQNLNI